MRVVHHDEHTVMITLSRRNLQGLLAKLDDPTSLRTLLKIEKGVRLYVEAEEDEEHYRDRPEGPPGPMAERTEKAIAGA